MQGAQSRFIMLKSVILFAVLFYGTLALCAPAVDLSEMPDRLPDMVAGQTVLLDVSSVKAKGGLESVRWKLKPSLASRRYELSLVGETRFERDWRHWYFKAPSLDKDTLLTLDFTAIARAKNKQGKKYRAKKSISVLVKAGTGKVSAVVEADVSTKGITLSAKASSSGNGNIVQYIWRQTEGPLLAIDPHAETLSFAIPSFEHNDIGVFTSDLSPDLPIPSPKNVAIPKGIQNHVDITYTGAFRVDADAGEEGSTHFGPSVIGVNPENTSIFVAGTKGSVAEMKIPAQFGLNDKSADLPFAEVLQNYFKVQDKTTVGQLDNYVINGLLIYKDSLIITCEHTYDTKGRPWNIQHASNAYDLANSDYKGFLQLEGKSRAAGFMSEIPKDMRHALKGEYLAGWGSNFSIDNRYSLGPSLFSFNPQDIVDANISVNPRIPTRMHMAYSIANLISKGANAKSTLPNDPIWGLLASAHFGFIVPNTRKYIVFGRHAGLEGGVGYKISQVDGGNTNGGERTYLPDDTYPYFWIFDVDDILRAKNEYDPQPISYGKFMLPYLINEQSFIRGGSWNANSNTLYLSVSNAVDEKYAKAPVILAFEVKAKNEASDYPSIPRRLSFDLTVIDNMGYTDTRSISVDVPEHIRH
ncbi:hypothetical protein ACFO4O_08625 [Glaciecola siphonariae]|uniref:Uncharacterized protein n=1 Tax=Glaciecola siphonariae TaxID=521012 RepID=A0ABV9LUM0_9ALTE